VFTLKFRHYFYLLNSCLHILVAIISFGNIFNLAEPALAETNSECIGSSKIINNQALYSYENADTSTTAVKGEVTSNKVSVNLSPRGTILITARGIKTQNGSLVLGSVTGALNNQVVKLGFTQEEANKGILAVTQAWKALPTNTTFQEIAISAKNALIQAVPVKAALIQQLGSSDLEQATVLATQVSKSVLGMVGLTPSEAESATRTALAIINNAPSNTDLNQVGSDALNAMISEQPSKADVITQAGQAFARDFNNLRAGTQFSLKTGDKADFQFLLSNPGNSPLKVLVPNNNANSTTTSELVVPAGGGVQATVEMTAGSISATGSSMMAEMEYANDGTLQTKVTGSGSVTGYKYKTMESNLNLEQPIDCSSKSETVALLLPISSPLVDPLGQVTGCAGELLPDYNGFSVGFYEPDPSDPTGGVRGLSPLTGTELPDIPGNDIPKGAEPNIENSNPYFLTNGNQGKYNFLFDKNRGQLDKGKTFILLVNPPGGSIYAERRIRVVIGDRNANSIAYTATSLDGKPISSTDNRTSVNGTINIQDAERVGLNLAVLSIKLGICQAQEIQIIKTGDRAAAEPGDTVIYRLSVRNQSSANLENIVVTDTLPLGFQFRPDSVRAELQGSPVRVTTNHNGSTVKFNVAGNLPSRQILNIAYAAVLTPDALRGTGRNSAIVNGQRVDNRRSVKDGPATHQLRIKAGILSDYGTIIGRVFVDKNFDGEQQPGEAGVPNAVILMDNGNRITTDVNGLFSVSNVIPGYRTGVLDLSSLPGYTFAPNRFFSERNSQSRLVHLAPGSMVRMNFGVTPSAKEVKNQ
jgi:uncharacterized repeat protein (TIGR01451 family)